MHTRVGSIVGAPGPGNNQSLPDHRQDVGDGRRAERVSAKIMIRRRSDRNSYEYYDQKLINHFSIIS